jgi:hypothetical protein
MNIIGIFLLLILFGCSSNGDPDQGDNGPTNPPEDGYTTIHYTPDTGDFPNPDRGFYRYTQTRASQYSALYAEELKAFRSPGSSNNSEYQTINTLIFRYFILDSFKDGPVSQDFLDAMQMDFDAAREAGVKLIPRFTYTVSSMEGNCPEGFICPPYGDAPVEIVLAQIGQLGPVLTQNADVISCVQLGFIGTWGENYYTDYFGDASSNGGQGKLLDENWEARLAVLKALLAATPDEIMVQVRYPQMKQRFVYGINADTSVSPLTRQEAFSAEHKARIGFHNDCLFASADDFGTYEDYGNSSTPRRTDIPNLKDYFAKDSKYVIVGGETCSDGFSPENDCAPAGMAEDDLRLLHYTYLNADYNNEVNNDWAEGGCIEAIKRNLGYRFVLNEAVLPEEIKSGSSFKVQLSLENVGYASPVKERKVKLIFKSTNGSGISEFDIDTDVRMWFDQISLSQSFTADNLPKGTYDVFLKLEDPHESIKDMPEYSIRLANTDMWEDSTGYNNLQHRVEVK